MPTVLSTKKLKLNQKSLLLNAGISLVEYDAINIDLVSFEAPKSIENAIFTSQNAIKSFVGNVHSSAVENAFCVGEKTKSLLEQNGFKVNKMSEYASELADFIVENHKNESFHFFCGNIRKDEIPSKLRENGIELKEIEVYKTKLNPKKFQRTFDAILIFSPSGVRSYCEANLQGNAAGNHIYSTMMICIGKSTANEAKKYTENVVIANTTTIESVITKTVKSLNGF
ncbi:uroporphyrinogen-III synthase [Aequorivita echinoideorum]|uniref:Uroporphyrinogen-III synthase n=1 Tax=Aequorivita echinoideorum TaxID=1549647 RepID=A0ABS5S3U0_9FLAO|nr:uroporphyrinogen-III synthase [Aequorivita echinoideorum]MBT0607881.1 uroporphyrinogen-III synthase [Aequorivita echinoideorum]